MTLIYIAWGCPDFFKDTVRLACARAGLPTVVISDIQPRVGELWFPVKEFITETEMNLAKRRSPPGPLHHLNTLSFARWMVLSRFMSMPHRKWPVVCLDWDTLVFSDLRDYSGPFLGFDFAVTRDDNGLSAAPLLITSPAPLDAALDHLVASPDCPNDMAMWLDIAPKFSVGTMSEVVNGGMFDHQLPGNPDFERDGERKKIVFDNGVPYFIRKGERIKAHVMHCWANYKEEIPSLVKQAGL